MNVIIIILLNFWYNFITMNSMILSYVKKSLEFMKIVDRILLWWIEYSHGKNLDYDLQLYNQMLLIVIIPISK